MADTITEEERALIDAALADGKITKVAPGVRAIVLRSDPDANQLRYDTGEGSSPPPRWRSTGRPRDPAVTLRRQDVARLARAGLSKAQIAAQLHVGWQVVNKDLKEQGIAITPAPHPSVAAVAARDHQIAAAYDGVRTVQWFCEEFGVSTKVIRAALKRLGLAPINAPSPRDLRIKARRDQVARLAAEGLTAAQIAAKMPGVSYDVARKDIETVNRKAA